MADPLTRPLKWSKNFQVYVEKHNIYDVLQELLKQMIIVKPDDPLAYIRDETPKIAKSIYSLRTFTVGTKFAELLGKRLAALVGAKHICLDEIINKSDAKEELSVFLEGEDKGDNNSRKLLITTIQKCVSAHEFDAHGYILHGFPQNKTQALLAQQLGLLPRQVFIFFPETGEEDQMGEGDAEEDIYEPAPGTEAPKPKLSLTQLAELKGVYDVVSPILKEIASSYHFEICKSIPYEKVLKTPKDVLEAELLGYLMTVKASHAPFIPRIIVIGPPLSGKTSISSFLSSKFEVVDVDWLDLVRGACRWEDAASEEAKLYLKEYKPMSDESVKTLISRRLEKEDCEKKGWVLHGFPEKGSHCQVLESLHLDPNRVFMLNCPLDLSVSRAAKKRKTVLNRELQGITPQKKIDESGDSLLFPFGVNAVTKRYENYALSLDGIIPYYGPRIIHVDAAMKFSQVKNFVESSIHRPPIPR